MVGDEERVGREGDEAGERSPGYKVIMSYWSGSG